ncbi:OadG family protein [Candidatus Formimonas warabiya]|uniref:Oxaloacetate decarboxylase, gamma chain n=1 Tax=Formimonas warabiya TaxID=1761012 RepID=A0A3G1KPG2_FORW1|nr:OadG family protein [Candidatus Formimonas warabiya]ATW24352.1 hypothetical protein DCMF_05740 [Candidatus Formimonas warabiya]
MHISQGPLTVLLGLGIFIILALLPSLFKKNRTSGVEAVVKPEPPVPAKAPVLTPVQTPKGISPALVAAITASICAMTGKSAEEFTFTAIRRVSGSHPVWSFVGTTDIIATRQRFIERGNR